MINIIFLPSPSTPYATIKKQISMFVCVQEVRCNM